MFILPSRGRSHNMRRFIDACADTKQSARCLVYLDDDDPKLSEYRRIEFPPWWLVHMGPAVGIGGIYEWIYKTFPDEPYYGFVADDLIPRTNGWDQKLIEAADARNISYPNDRFWQQGELATHPCLGGELVREIGWLSYPGMKRTYIDTVWHTIGQSRGVLRYLPDVVLEHMHYLNNKSPYDDTYAKATEIVDDRETYQRFLREWPGN